MTLVGNKMCFNYAFVEGLGFEDSIKVDVRCDFCASYYKLLVIVDKKDSLDEEHMVGKQLKRNGYISFEECGDCNE